MSSPGPGAGERPRAHCTVDADGRMTLRITGPTAPATASRPRLLLRLRPPKGRPERLTRTVDLAPGTGPGEWRTAIGPDPALDEGRWDLYLLPTPDDDIRTRLLPGVRDLRALVPGRTPGTAPTPLAVRVPYVTLDGYLAVRTWLRAGHAEVDRVRVADAAMTVHGRVFGAALGAGAAAVLRRRGQGGVVRETPVTGRDTHAFAFTAAYRDLPEASGTAGPGPGVWDVFVRPSADAPLVRAARLLDDVADRKKVFVYPASPVPNPLGSSGGLAARPYYTVDNDLAVEITGD
ncbi:transferase [Streptomyces sp. NPDC093252]|uniref:transferase n=1 Tax=Streptomyces sp. NPDC093252 TaxID=3154980 RepID=UPI0034144E80